MRSAEEIRKDLDKMWAETKMIYPDGTPVPEFSEEEKQLAVRHTMLNEEFQELCDSSRVYTSRLRNTVKKQMARRKEWLDNGGRELPEKEKSIKLREIDIAVLADQIAKARKAKEKRKA